MTMEFDITESEIESIRILHVDDDSSLGEMTVELLEREDDRFECITETNAIDALEYISEDDIDCIVSDYDMPRMNGLEFLDAVREEYDDLPFILFTGKGSEEIASEAISAGVTDYLQKEGNIDQYTVLANRIVNTVAQKRAEKRIERIQERFRKLVEHSTDVISVVDEEGRWQYLTPSSRRILGYDPEEIIGDVGFDYIHPEDRQEAFEQFAHSIENPEWIPTVEFRYDHPEEGWIWLENHGRNMIDDPVIEGFIVHTREINERKRQAEELKRQNERLEEFASLVSHDLRNPLSVASGRLSLAKDECASEHLEEIDSALDRMEAIIEGTLTLARSGTTVGELETLELSTVVTNSWRNVATADAELKVEDDGTITANPNRLRTLFENLFRNAVEHGSTSPPSDTQEDADRPEADGGVTVRVGAFSEGFYVADDGPGIPPEDRGTVFESKYSTGEDGAGLGLTICKQIAEAHGWNITIAESKDGGTRVETTGVDIE